MWLRLKRQFEALCQGKYPADVAKTMHTVSAAQANTLRKEFKEASAVCNWVGRVMGVYIVVLLQALITKVNNLLTRTIKTRGVKTAGALASLCPSNLQTTNMMKTADITSLVPLIPTNEWEQYIAQTRVVLNAQYSVWSLVEEKSYHE